MNCTTTMNCKMKPWASAFLVVALTAGAAIAADAQPIQGIGPTGEVTKVHGDFKFTEGPAWDGHGNLYFSDIPAKTIYKLDSAGKVSKFLEPSGTTNGLMFDAHGKLDAASMEGKLIQIDVATKKVTVLADGYEGKRFNAPNDLVIDRSGGIYFTDPHFLSPMPLPQGVKAFYYRSADGKVTRLGEVEAAPNGVILSPDEKTLYIIPSLQAEMLAYDVESPGKIGKQRVFCTLQQAPGATNGGGDGLTIDTAGNLYITSKLGLQVFNPQGKLLGIIPFPEQPANCAFGGPDGKTLFVTARTSLYSVPMEAKGHVFAQPK